MKINRFGYKIQILVNLICINEFYFLCDTSKLYIQITLIYKPIKICLNKEDKLFLGFRKSSKALTMLFTNCKKLSRILVLTDELHIGKLKWIFNDPDIKEQWYFIKEDKKIKSLSHDLHSLWESNITGKGVKIAIVGKGVQHTHIDLARNYDITNSYNFVDESEFVYPAIRSHATESAGIIAGVANNSICGVGAAPSSTFSSLQIFNRDKKYLVDYIVSQALFYECTSTSIYLINWSLSPGVKISKQIGLASIIALKECNRFGRSELGSIYIKGAGDEGHMGNNCGFRGYDQRPEIFVLGAISSQGKSPDYSERCTAICAACLNGESLLSKDFLYTTKEVNKCDKFTGGYSVSGSIGAGILALLLSNNPSLTQRQVFILIVHTSKQYDTTAIRNKAGFLYSDSMGFGMLSAIDLVINSRDSILLDIPEEHICYTYTFRIHIHIPKISIKKIYIYTSGCLDLRFCVTLIEQLYFTFSLDTKRRNSVTIELESPSGTKFKILTPRKFDRSGDGFFKWTLKVLGYYGEPPQGVWIIYLHSGKFSLLLKEYSLEIYGTCVNPKSNIKNHNTTVDLAIKYGLASHANIFKAYTVSTKSSEIPKGLDLVSDTGNFFSEIIR